MKFSWSIVWWDRALVASHGQHLVGQKYSGEDKGCIRCATFHLDCYWSSCWTIKKTVYKSLVPWQNFAVCVRACSYKAQIVFRYCWLWSIDRSNSFLMSTHVFASKQRFTCYSQQTLKLYINSTCNTFYLFWREWRVNSIYIMKHVSMKDEFTRHRNLCNLRAVFFCYEHSSGLPFTEDLQQCVSFAWLAFPFSLRPTATVNC